MSRVLSRAAAVAVLGLLSGLAVGRALGPTTPPHATAVAAESRQDPIANLIEQTAPAGGSAVRWTTTPRRVDDNDGLRRLPGVEPPAPPEPRPEPAAVVGAAATRGSAVEEAIAAQPATVYTRLELAEAGAFRATGKTIRFAGIDALAADETCEGVAGPWPCGRRAVAALRDLVRQRSLHCVESPGADGSVEARCRVGRTDLSAWLVEQGWATPRPGDARLVQLWREAQANRVGQYGSGDRRTATTSP